MLVVFREGTSRAEAIHMLMHLSEAQSKRVSRQIEEYLSTDKVCGAFQCKEARTNRYLLCQ